jgi:hypothetical protein
VFDDLGELFADLGPLIKSLGLDHQPSPRALRRRRAAFEEGRVIKIGCKLRWPDAEYGRWARGRLHLSRASGMRWTSRFRSTRAMAIDHRMMELRGVRLSADERSLIAPYDAVIVYADDRPARLELALHRQNRHLVRLVDERLNGPLGRPRRSL